MEQTTKHPNSKTITIKRAMTSLERVQGPEVAEYFKDSKVSVGSFFESSTSFKVATGLTHSEEGLLLPELIDAEDGDRDFRKKVTDYYTDLDIKVPYDGAILEIGLEEDNGKPPSKKNWPLNLSDYIRYRVARRHPNMAQSKSEADSSTRFQFYIYDKEATTNTSRLANKEKDDAMKLYYSIASEPDKVRELLLLLGKDPREAIGKTTEDRELEQFSMLREVVEAKPKLFIETFNQDDLNIRYHIAAMVKTGVLTKYGERIQIGSDTKRMIGKNLNDAIAYFLDDENQDTIIQLKAMQQEEEKKSPKQVPLQTRKLNA